MADLTDKQAAQSVKIIGSDSSGLEQTPVQATSNGAAHVNLRDEAGAEKGVIANPLSVSPSSPSDTLSTVNIIALNGTASVSTQGRSTVTFQVGGTWIATVIFEATTNGTDWFQIIGQEISVNQSKFTSITTNHNIMIYCGSFSEVRAKASAFTSGTINISVDASSGSNDIDPTYGNNNTTAPLMSQLIAGIDTDSILRPFLVDDQGRLVTSAITGFGANFSFGDVNTSVIARVSVRRTAYIEQAADARRSIASSNVNDTAAGTGARTIKITYLDVTGAGPFIELITLNGTAYVNTIATNICYIEQIEVITAGSTGSNVGILTLKAASGGGGVTIGTINATDNQTFWTHHYVPFGKECNITGISCGHNGTTVGSGALFTLNSKFYTIVNGVETQVSDFVRLYGQTSTFSRSYSSPIKVLGPARLQIYVTPETSSSTIYRAAFDFFEP